MPSSEAGGARDEESTYRHLLVCDMELQALTAQLGRTEAEAVLRRMTHYEWIYDRVLTDPRVRELADAIIETQRREIAEMEQLIEELRD